MNNGHPKSAVVNTGFNNQVVEVDCNLVHIKPADTRRNEEPEISPLRNLSNARSTRKIDTLTNDSRDLNLVEPSRDK